MPRLQRGRLRYYKSTSVHLLVAVWVKQYPVGQRVRPAMHPIFQMMIVPAGVIRQSTTTVRT
ncbi:hypothetical protein SAMN05192544_1009169 [Paraburkholderia hospita]|nr:hypothetical protein SAMN05192544_1009169 [Paraburkholderia hospita]